MSTPPPPDGYRDVSQIALATGLSRSTILRAIKTPPAAGGLPGFTDATGRVLVKVKDADAWVIKRMQLMPAVTAAVTKK